MIQIEYIFEGEPPAPPPWVVTPADLERPPEYDAWERATILRIMNMTTEELDTFILESV